METLLWHYAYGRPTERDEMPTRNDQPVRFTLNIGQDREEGQAPSVIVRGIEAERDAPS